MRPFYEIIININFMKVNIEAVNTAGRIVVVIIAQENEN